MTNENPDPTDPEPLTVECLKKHEGDLKFWLSRTVQERWAAAEMYRRMTYGDEACDAPMDKSVFEVITREKRDS